MPAMAAADMRFALSNPSHYQTMFSGVLTDWNRYPDLVLHAEGDFNILLETIRVEQQEHHPRARTAAKQVVSFRGARRPATLGVDET